MQETTQQEDNITTVFNKRLKLYFCYSIRYIYERIFGFKHAFLHLKPYKFNFLSVNQIVKGN